MKKLKKKHKTTSGFTLLELLAVLVIMAALAVIAVPIFTNKSDEAKQVAQKATIATLEAQAQSYMWEAGVSGATADILPDMIAAGYIKEAPENPYKNVPNNGDKTYKISVDSQGAATAILTAGTTTEGSVTYNKPDLVEGMVPVKWDGTAWTLADVTNAGNDWYKYNGDLDNTTDADKNDGNVTAVNDNVEKWANVMLRDGCNGSTTFDGSMMVWVPRYTYKIDKTSDPKRIYIKYTAGVADDTSDGYLKHPGFKLGSQELTGIWVAKFEASPKEGVGNSTAADDVLTKHVQIKPDVSSWRYISIGKIFTACRNMNTDTSYGWTKTNLVDTHQMRNTEWGAVAYLTEAIRDGEEIWLNNYWSSPNTKTGASAQTQNAGATTTVNTYAQNIDGTYYAGGGAKASTTGNVYGIYDMSGGSWEYVSSYMSNGHSYITTYGDDDGNALNGVTITKTDNNKYVDKYEADASDNSVNWASSTIDNAVDISNANYQKWATKTGDAIYEVMNEVGGIISGVSWYKKDKTAGYQYNAWYGDYELGSWRDVPFFLRGGDCVAGSGAGLFSFSCVSGYPNYALGFRL